MRKRKPMTCFEAGRRGGYARLNNTTSEQRAAISRKAGLAAAAARRNRVKLVSQKP